ncbi:hypothetical protein [Chitinibacter sp. GC72]|uniref:hypothetical protein n=1 Tax=Chitinibacter sp. GC72 TaxID=1526917 RepID=UPI0012FCBAFE|nr:hypothetical protein [Chitinibacter sp. GC72]
MQLLVNFDAQLKALARLKELEFESSGGFAQAKYGESLGGGACLDMLPSGFVYQVRITGIDDRSYVFQRADLEATDRLIRKLPNSSDREVLALVYLTYGDMVDKAAYLGLSKQTLNYRRNAAVHRFAHHWQQMKQGAVKLPLGAGVRGRFVVQEAANI